MQKIAVIGKSGQLAQALAEIKTDQTVVMCYGRNDIDISDQESLGATLKQHHINAVINASAYTAVDLAEKEPEKAYALNYLAVENIAKACKELALPLVHISTDYVFSGDKGSPYLPSDDINPVGVYGKSKAAGEKAILEILPGKACIIRTSWLYSTYGNNFVKTMLKLMANKQVLGVICDQVGTPTSANNLAKVCLEAVIHRLSGVHHYTDAGVASWYDFAVAIQAIALEQGVLKEAINILPINTIEYPTPAQRPSYSVLDKKSLYNTLPNIDVVHWQNALSNIIKNLEPRT